MTERERERLGWRAGPGPRRDPQLYGAVLVLSVVMIILVFVILSH